MLCMIVGIVKSYAIAQITLLVTYHALSLGWSIMFPFHYRRLKVDGRIKYIHASTVTLGLVLPAIPALLLVIHGYTILPGPYEFCVSQNIHIAFFTLALPMSILLATTTSVFVILFWRILKVHYSN